MCLVFTAGACVGLESFTEVHHSADYTLKRISSSIPKIKKIKPGRLFLYVMLQILQDFHLIFVVCSFLWRHILCHFLNEVKAASNDLLFKRLNVFVSVAIIYIPNKIYLITLSPFCFVTIFGWKWMRVIGSNQSSSPPSPFPRYLNYQETKTEVNYDV